MKAKRMPTDDDKYMILDPDLWPSWPYLPVKRKNNSLEDGNLGVLLATQEHADGRYIIYHVYMFAPPKGKEQWDAAPRTEYKTVDEMLQDGWVVD